MEKKTDRLDAGLASHDHYKNRLPRWRYRLRQVFLPIVRWETPYVAFLQERMRNKVLDNYFAMTANLGTHTAFMLVLPILFWCGYMPMGRAMVHILAAGVCISGFVKDLLCLPRPLSPPLVRITMSGSAALEYGFPSTHSTNAVSVAYYALYVLRYQDPDISRSTNLVLQVLCHIYALSIVLGRLYCGMHGFFDVVIGSALGALIGAAQCHLGPVFDAWLYTSPIQNIVGVVIALIVLIRIYPEPADDCPCFEDSVAFASVCIGCEASCWRIAQSFPGFDTVEEVNLPFDLERMGWGIALLRIVLGVLAIFVWRGTMKPLLLKGLPPCFRFIEHIGLDAPRRFFMRASQYSTVPRQRNDDNVIPSARDIPAMLSNLGRKRAVSIGPQSQADAYETLAYREKQRRDSLSKAAATANIQEGSEDAGYFTHQTWNHQPKKTQGRKRASSIEEFRKQMGMGAGALSPMPLDTPHSPFLSSNGAGSHLGASRDKELFASLQKPRVRYDVEVVTKLIIYSGIAWIAIEGNPSLWQQIGLSV